MRKTFNIFLALLITVFTLPFSNNIVSAESSNGLKDGTYTMDYSVHYDGMDVDKYFKKPAILKVENGKNYVQLEHSDSNFILGITLPNGGDVDVISEDKENKTRVVGFNVSDLSQSLTIGMKMFYGSTHEVRVDFDLDSLVKVADEDNSDNEISNGTYTMDYSVHYDGMDVDKYFKKPAILKVENGKNYVQLEHSDSNFILGITLPNGGDVDVISEDKENKTRVVGFNVSDLSQPLTIGMKMFYGSTHEVRVDFDLDSLVKITEDDESNNPDEPEEPKEIEIKKGHENPVNGGDKVTISGDASTQLTLPEGLPAGTTLVINSVKDKEYVTNHKGYIVAGEVYEFNFSNLGDNPGKFELTMGYDTSKFKSKDVDIYYYNEAKGKWIEQNGIVKDGKITIHPTHFSTYGVFAKENVKGDSKEEKSTDIDYIVKHETKDEPSIANDFFIKPGKLIEKNGEKYIQVKVNGWNMFNSLTADKSNVNVIDENNDSAVIEIKIVGKLSDPIMLTMDMAYGGKHHARLILNPDEDDNNNNNNKNENNNKNNNNKNNNKNNNNNSDKSSNQVTKQNPDKAYTIDYVIKHETEDKVSAADDFFRKPGILLIKGDDKYIQLTVDNWEWIVYLKTVHGDVDVVKINKDGSAVIQFKVDGDLSDVITLDMHIVVPKEVAGMEYDMKHLARLFLDQTTMKEDDPSKYQIVIHGDDKLKKPKFGSNTDNNDANGLKSTGNPKTGDTTSMLLYVLLLVGSAIPLAIKFRRRSIL